MYCVKCTVKSVLCGVKEGMRGKGRGGKGRGG